MHNGIQGRRLIRRDRQAPCPARLAQNDNIASSTAISPGSRAGTTPPMGDKVSLAADAGGGFAFIFIRPGGVVTACYPPCPGAFVIDK